jgi:hypothetical protein
MKFEESANLLQRLKVSRMLDLAAFHEELQRSGGKEPLVLNCVTVLKPRIKSNVDIGDNFRQLPSAYYCILTSSFWLSSASPECLSQSVIAANIDKKAR